MIKNTLSIDKKVLSVEINGTTIHFYFDDWLENYPNILDDLISNHPSVKLHTDEPPDMGWNPITNNWVNRITQPSPHHVFNYATKQWEDPRTLQDLKTAQWTLIKRARTQAEYAGFTWDGSTFDSDATSQARITGAVTLAQLSPTFSTDWILANNAVRTLIAQDMCAVGVALGTHVQTQFSRGQALRAQIDAATTKEAVEAVVW